MHRTTETMNRPEPHVYVPSPDGVCGAVVTLSQSLRSGFCGLAKGNALHVPADEVYQPTPVEDVSDRMIGEH